MRIVHIITRLIIGGAQENTLISCIGQHAAGHDVTLITGPSVGPEGSLMDKAGAAGFKVEVLDVMRRSLLPGKDYATYRHLKKRLRAMKPDVVHTHSSKAGIIGRWAAHHAGCPFVVHTIHGLAFTASTSRLMNAVYRYSEKITAPITDKIVCVADAMRDQSLAADIGKPEQYVTIYSGMDVDTFIHPPVPRETVRRELGLADEHIAVGTVARLFDLKGHDDLLALAPGLCARFPNLRFVWIGDGTLRPRFEQQIAAMNLKDRFILTGLVSPARVPELVGALDIMVHPSRREGLARALPQGALARCPVVTYDVDGNREGLIDGQTGYLIPPFDQSRLADALTKLLADADLRKRFGEAGRAFAQQRFGSQTMVDQLERLYADGTLISRGRPAPG